jgi:hypothetical protein
VSAAEEALHAALKAANPGYNGMGRFTMEGGEITEAVLDKTGITDLSPLRGLPLTKLGFKRCAVTNLLPLVDMPLKELNGGGNDDLSDLSPLTGIKTLERLVIWGCAVADLEPLRGLPLEFLDCCGTNTPLTDIGPLEGMPLVTLWLPPGVSDLSPLRGMPLRVLGIFEGRATDLTPLAGMSLQKLTFPPAQITRGIEVVREMESILYLGPDWRALLPSDDFWRKYDAGEFDAPHR